MKRVLLLAVLFLLLIPQALQAQVIRGDFVQVELLASTTPTASTPVVEATGSTISRMQNFKEAVIVLNATASPYSAGAGQLLRVWVQHSADSGTTWTDLLRFADLDGTTSSPKRYAYWSSSLAAGPWVTSLVADVERGLENRSIAAGTVNMGPIGSQLRVVYNYASTTASWTFNVTGFFRR